MKQRPLDIAHGTIAEVLARARKALAGHGDGHNDEAIGDAEVLLRDTLGCTRAWLIAHSDESLPQHMLAPYLKRLRRRAAGQPIAYITGRREFWSLPLNITADVLIPRPDTELLVECALDLLPAHSTGTVCDLGTGSGAVALAIASERPLVHLIATDSSRPALRLARLNARQLAAAGRDHAPQFAAAHWLSAFADDSLDLVVSNPPYVRSNDPHLALGDLRFEPAGALVAGDDGLDDLRAIIEQAPRCLRQGGWIALEHGHDQGCAVRALLGANGFGQLRTHTDLAGHERVCHGQLPAVTQSGT